MPRTPALRAVKPDETPTPKQPRRVDEAAKSGDHLALLVAMRDRIATAVSRDDCPPRDLASLTRRLADIAKDIETLQLARTQDRERDQHNDSADATFDASAI